MMVWRVPLIREWRRQHKILEEGMDAMRGVVMKWLISRMIDLGAMMYYAELA